MIRKTQFTDGCGLIGRALIQDPFFEDRVIDDERDSEIQDVNPAILRLMANGNAYPSYR